MSDENNDRQDLKKLHDLMRRYEKPLIRFAFSYTGDWEASEDYVLESFLYYWSNRHTLDENDNLPAYILTVVKHKCLNHLRRVKHLHDASDRIREKHQWELNLQINSLQVCDPKDLFASEIYEIMEKTLDRLPPSTKQIFYLSRFQNKRRKEIAETMSMSVKGVEYHLKKALTALRDNLKDYLMFLFF